MGKIRNWARWSEILIIIFPAIRLSDGSVKKILSISVLDPEQIRVGEVVWDMKELEKIMSKKFAESLFSSLVNKSILKSPNSSMSFLFNFVSFNN